MTFVDTNILIDALRGYAPAVQFLSGAASSSDVTCSQVSEVELLLGAPSMALRRPVERLLRDITVITPTDTDFRVAVRFLRRHHLSQGVEFFDCLIAATALRLGTEVHSRNVKHMSVFRGLRTNHPYS